MHRRLTRSRYALNAATLYLCLAAGWAALSDPFLTALGSDLLPAPWGAGVIDDLCFAALSTLFIIKALLGMPDRNPGEPGPRQGVDLAALGHDTQAWRARQWSWILAVALPLLMLALQHILGAGPGRPPLLMLFLLPIAVAALMGGWWPGMLATAIVTGGAAIDLLPLLLRGEPPRPVYELLQLLLLVANGALVSYLSQRLMRSVSGAKASANLLNAVVSGTPDAVFVKDMNGRYLLANASVARIVGLPLDRILGNDDSTLFTPETARRIMAIDRDIRSQARTQTAEYPVTLKTGEQLDFWVTKGPVFDAQGQVCGLFGISHDITARKSTERALARSDAELQAAQRLADMGNWSWNVATDVHTWSPDVYRIYGRDPTQPPARYPEVQHCFTPASWTQLAGAVERALATGESYACDAEVVRPDGRPCWITARGQAVRDAAGSVVELHGSIQDISHRKLAALAVQRTATQLQLVLDAVNDGLWDWDLITNVVYRSPRYFEVVGYPADKDTHDFDFLQKIIHPDDGAFVHATINAHLNGQTPGIEFECRVITLQGEQRWMQVRGRAVTRDTQGRALRVVGTNSDITDKRKATERLLLREQQLERVIAGSDQGYWDWDLSTHRIDISPRLESMLGYATGTLNLSGSHWKQLIHPDDLPRALTAIDAHRSGQAPQQEAELRMKTASGGWRWILSRGRIVERAPDGTALMMSGTHTDISERKTAEEALHEAAAVFDNTYEGIMVVDAERRITKVNAAFERITGYSAQEVLGETPHLLASGRQGADFYQELWSAVRKHGFWKGEIWNRRKNGDIYPELLSISVIAAPAGGPPRYVGVFSDISELKAHETALDTIAHYDVLTGVPNRRLLGDRLEQALARTRRNNKTLAVCYLDLDGFKAVNDQYGHHAGDDLLVQTTQKLKAVLRADDTLARPGGDEFVLLLADIDNAREVNQLAARLLSTVALPVLIEGHMVSVSVSMGYTLFPADNADADTLLRHADQAMYQAKDAGKNRVVMFDPVHSQQVIQHRAQIDRLEQAYHDHEFVLHYQPKVDLTNGAVIGVEALIRWEHPERGLLPPAEFIAQVENSPLDAPLGNWTIAQALRQAHDWQQQGIPLKVSVNISATHLLQPEFVSQLQQMLAQQPDVQPQQLELEILETAGLADMTRAIHVLEQCEALGVSFSLDDFGTGYSSLAYFRRLPVQMIKIDQSFVRNMLLDPDDFGIVDSVVRLAKAFNRPVIAEGVETLAHGSRLLDIGCHLAQGYGIARPMPAQAVPAWMIQWATEQCWVGLNHVDFSSYLPFKAP
jgi:diguanylate cyclase (GGDEF)-like protein/PAS domain S-box-containing protein